MQVLDVVLPDAKTELEEWERWQNRWQAELIPKLSSARKIEVTFRCPHTNSRTITDYENDRAYWECYDCEEWEEI